MNTPSSETFELDCTFLEQVRTLLYYYDVKGDIITYAVSSQKLTYKGTTYDVKTNFLLKEKRLGKQVRKFIVYKK